MEKWQAELRLKFRGVPWKIKVGFTYEWKAWLIAYEHAGKEPNEFSQLDPDRQITELAYGAAAWHLMKRNKKVFFSYRQLVDALLRASKADNMKLTEAMKYAQFPQWLQGNKDEKKNDKT